ncbi:tetratricopeptide repeat protein [Vibrio cincinnatiensis]|uniref:tetratricopeptide repeat protein n=1 Tax=Vibrio cincinnatiensis TaxID=675 RepID=UPI0012AD0E7E|nr:tetratricopeptide repeat protein [Vibrio cincinnatiensis]
MNKIQQNLERLKSQIETSNSEDILLEANKLLLQAKQINFVSGIITALIILARVHWLREEYDPSVELIKEAESYHNNQDNDEILPEILHLYALNALSCSQHYTAKKYWLDALDKAMFTNNMVIEIESLLGIGDVLFSLEEYARSIEIFELAVQIANKTKNRKLEVRAYILLAKSYFELNHYIDMLTVLDLAEEKVDGKQCPTWNIKLWLLKSSALLKLNRIKDAKNAAFQAYNLSMSTSSTNLRIHALGCLSKIALASDNNSLNTLISETTWWEKLMIFKASLNNNAHSVIMFYHDNPRVIDECEKLISPLCVNNDFLSRLNHKRLGLLIFGLDSAETVYKKIKMILRLYPWDRKGLIGEKPAVSYQDVLSFPFTIEQLDGSLNLEELEEY